MQYKEIHTEKEMMFIKDELDAEELTIKKLMDYKTDLNDPGLSNLADEMINKHKDHYNRLLSHIKE